jgi:hypothetical protein
MVWTKVILNTALASVLVGGFLMLGGATTVRADDDDNCRRNIDKWEDKLERDTHRFGYDSRQARHDRHELGEARESCERHHDYDRHYRYDYDRDGDRR